MVDQRAQRRLPTTSSCTRYNIRYRLSMKARRIRWQKRKGFGLAWFMSIEEGSQIALDRRLVAWVIILPSVFPSSSLPKGKTKARESSDGETRDWEVRSHHPHWSNSGWYAHKERPIHMCLSLRATLFSMGRIPRPRPCRGWSCPMIIWLTVYVMAPLLDSQREFRAVLDKWSIQRTPIDGRKRALNLT